MARANPVKSALAAVAATLVVGCAGVVDEEVYAPITQASEPARGAFRTYTTVIDLGDASIVVWPVVLSEKLRVIYGPALILPALGAEKKILDEPLRIRMWVELLHGVAAVDLSKVAVRLGRQGRTLYPISVDRQSPSVRLEGPVQLTGQKSTHQFVLTYGISTTQLEPFALHIPEVHLNGRSIAVRPIAFDRSTREAVR